MLLVARTALMLLATAWIGLAAASLVQSQGDASWLLVALMVVNAAVLAVLGYLIARNRTRYWIAATIYLALNALLSVTDEVGLLDWLAFVTSLAALGLVLGAWRAETK
jgi:hypothetical protein